LTANSDENPASVPDRVADSESSKRVCSVSPSGVADNVLTNFTDEWEEKVDELVTWTDTLNVQLSHTTWL